MVTAWLWVSVPSDPVAIVSVQFREVVVPVRTKSKGISNQCAYDSARRTICNIHSLTLFLSPHLGKSVIPFLRSTSHVRRTRKIARLANPDHYSRRYHPAADDTRPARVRARCYFPFRQTTRHQRAGFNLSHSDRRSDGEDGFAGG